ncbi:MFS transporter [Rhodococcus wratislaviensis]|uniref:Putative aromatic acid transporter n=1 Tax=Rhodococcus wratislaviensis NBRC 100605 TaxID=1219028 RepID=X0R7D7_RHOWR|nr:MFS transporter [Rhodococcus wratislaviensis]GAF46890.1 putative aromatic acid transporter [Rhodococcus wratislaviensis NBRC 100605]
MVNNRTIGSTPPTTVRKAVMGLTFFAVFIDGYDTAILALLVPHLAEEWGVKAAAFTYPLVLTSVGVVVGYLSCGALAQRLGQKRALVLGTALFGIATVMSAATLHLESMAILSVTRTITGIGLGIVAPIAIVIGTQNGPAEKKQSIAVFITTGLITGATIAGFTGGLLIEGLGTAGVLWLAGVVPLVLAVLLSCFIPNSPEHTGQENTSSESVAAAILGPKLRTSTLVLWTATFLVFVVSYTLKSWLPTLFEDFGMSRSTAGLGLAFFGLGGMGGGLILIAVSAKFGTTRSLVVMSLIGALATTAVAVLPANTAVLLFLICIAGAGITACSVGQTGIAVSIYEMSIRTKGVGWAAACGRIGSIVGPAIAGVLLGFAWPAQDIVLLLAVPILITTVCWLILSKRIARTDHETVEQAGVKADSNS